MARVPYLVSAKNSAVKEALAAVVEQRGYVSIVHRALANSPTGLRAFEAFSMHVNRESRLDIGTREMVILRTVQLVGNEYEWRRHLPKALEAGVSLAQAQSLHDRHSVYFTERERAVLSLVDDYLTSWSVSATIVDSVRALYGDELLIEILLTLGWYLLVSTIILPLDVISDDQAPTELAVPFVGATRRPINQLS